MNFKNKQVKNIFFLKSILNQVSVIALPEQQLLRQLSQNAIILVPGHDFFSDECANFL